jgi:hypothetical protein
VADEVLVYRDLQSHEEPYVSPRVQWLLFGSLGVALLAFAAWSLYRMFPQLGRMGWEGWLALGASFWQKLREKDAAWLPLVYLFCGTVVSGWRWLSSRHLQLHITPQGLRQEHRLPLGLHHLFGQNWQLDWKDVRSITTRRAGVASGFARPLTCAEIVLKLPYGRERVLRPTFWFRPGDPPRRRLKSLGSPWSLSQPWAGPDNDAQLARAFADLRLVRALHRYAPLPALALPWRGVAAASSTDLNSQPEVLALVGGAAVVFVTGLALMLYAPNLHLHASPTWADRATWALGTLALWALAWQAWARHRASGPAEPVPVALPPPRVPLSKPALAFAAVLWMAVVAFVIEPLLVHTALLGRADAWHTHRFALAGGWAKPIDPDAAHIPPIELPGAQSRLAWIKPGSEAELATVQCRWGLWVFNDAPLRDLATQQGVR